MQKERASIPKVGLSGCFSLTKNWEKSEISERDLQKPFGEFKTVNSILLTKNCSHHIEISIKDILTNTSKNIFYIDSAPQEYVVTLRQTFLKGTIVDEFDVEYTGNNQQRTINKNQNQKLRLWWCHQRQRWRWQRWGQIVKFGQMTGNNL